MLELILFIGLFTGFLLFVFTLLCLPVVGFLVACYILLHIIMTPLYFLYKFCSLAFNFEKLFLFYGNMLPVFFILACLYAILFNHYHERAPRAPRAQ
ncbi:hypothetical protein FPQ18DRAFT_328117 [Pyronema domesticum]|nr:hypothetical protein FPQ18DRAFT_328117 [Pyronema domesticum]